MENIAARPESAFVHNPIYSMTIRHPLESLCALGAECAPVDCAFRVALEVDDLAAHWCTRSGCIRRHS